MRPLVSGLFVAAFFGVLAAHTSHGFLYDYFAEPRPIGITYLDRWIKVLLIAPLGREYAAYFFVGLAAIFGPLVFRGGLAAQRRGSTQRYSTF